MDKNTLWYKFLTYYVHGWNLYIKDDCTFCSSFKHSHFEQTCLDIFNEWGFHSMTFSLGYRDARHPVSVEEVVLSDDDNIQFFMLTLKPNYQILEYLCSIDSDFLCVELLLI